MDGEVSKAPCYEPNPATLWHLPPPERSGLITCTFVPATSPPSFPGDGQRLSLQRSDGIIRTAFIYFIYPKRVGRFYDL